MNCQSYGTRLLLVPIPKPCVARLVVVYDKQTNAAALTPAQVLTAVGTINAATSPKNLENRDRFTILRDIRTPMAAAETTDYEPPPKAQVYQSITLPVTFNAGDAGTVADITTGSLYAIFISDQGCGSALVQLHLPCALRGQVNNETESSCLMQRLYWGQLERGLGIGAQDVVHSIHSSSSLRSIRDTRRWGLYPWVQVQDVPSVFW